MDSYNENIIEIDCIGLQHSIAKSPDNGNESKPKY